MSLYSSLMAMSLLVSSVTLSNAQQLKGFVDFNSRGGTVTVEIMGDNVTITLTVNDGSYVATGFGATSMDGTYAIIASDTTNVQENKLGDHESGTQLDASVTVISDSYTDNVRTMICTRSATPDNSDYFDFRTIDENGESISIIWATRNGEAFQKHSSKGSKTLTFFAPTVSPTNQPTSVPTEPTAVPSYAPTDPSVTPTSVPSYAPTEPSVQPTYYPSTNPSKQPSGQPTLTFAPTDVPSNPSYTPTTIPSAVPSNYPSVSPTAQPTDATLLGSVTITSAEDSEYTLEGIVKVFDDDTVRLYLTGPDGQWYGFGFGNKIMNNTYTIIASGNGTITQRILGDHEPGEELSDNDAVNYYLMSNSVEDNLRTVVLKTNVDDIPFDLSGITDNSGLKYIIATSPEFNLDFHDYRAAGIASGNNGNTQEPEETKASIEPKSDSIRYQSMGNIVMILSGLMVLFGMW